MNNNFLNFIEKDISAKKTLISTMPKRTKTNKKKFNESIEVIEKKYEDYRNSVKNYLLAKNRSLQLKNDEDVEYIDKLKRKIECLGNVKFLLNPFNTFCEKMGFDNLLYQLNNYYVFNFNSLNDILNDFLDKFEQAGIYLTSDDFNYTCYVHEYMASYLEVRNKKVKNYEKVSEIFEQIYWINPEIVEHIDLNLRKLIKINEKKFNIYISKIQKRAMQDNKIKNYVDCLEKLQATYVELNLASKEDIYDIIVLSKTKGIDINQYMDKSKIKISAYNSLVPTSVDINDVLAMNKICKALDKLRLNIDEYSSYLEFIPLFNDFKNEYEKLIPDDGKKLEYKGLKEVEDEINKKEADLERINKKIFSGKPGFFEFKSDNGLKQLKLESIHKAKELSELYEKYDQEYFKDKVFDILTNTMSISDLLNLYYSFDYFKKLAIKRVYNLVEYDDVIKYSDNFDMFAMDPTNIIINGICVFEESNIPKIISNKYRLNNIVIKEEDLDANNLENLKNNILILLRENTIKNSDTSVLKIWFMVQVEKLIEKEQDKN